jgi:hypothetical protein
MRQAVANEELLRLLNEALSTEADTDDCRFDGPIYRLRDPDPTGTNWSDALQLWCSERPAEPSVSAARRAIAKVRTRYNLE